MAPTAARENLKDQQERRLQALEEGELDEWLADSNYWLWISSRQRLNVFLSHRANLRIAIHARSSPGAEVAGLLLGQAFRVSKVVTCVAVHEIVEGRLAVTSQTEVNITPETWLAMHDERERRFPDLSVVGWYHSHPGLGIFLSERDVFIHESFFQDPWQIALVVDPKGHLGGFFFWDHGELHDPKRSDRTFKMANPVTSTQPQHQYSERATSPGAPGRLEPPQATPALRYRAASRVRVTPGVSYLGADAANVRASGSRLASFLELLFSVLEPVAVLFFLVFILGLVVLVLAMFINVDPRELLP